MNSGGCGGGCRCAGDVAQIKNDAQCAIPVEPVTLDESGKCPCGKNADDCCHKDELIENGHDALGELCESHDGK